MDKKEFTEEQIELSILKYLTSKKIWVRKHYDQSARINGRYKKNSWQVKGCADLLVLLNRVIYLEVKTKHGKQSRDQITFQRECKKNNVPYFVVRSAKEAMQALASFID